MCVLKAKDGYEVCLSAHLLQENVSAPSFTQNILSEENNPAPRACWLMHHFRCD